MPNKRFAIHPLRKWIDRRELIHYAAERLVATKHHLDVRSKHQRGQQNFVVGLDHLCRFHTAQIYSFIHADAYPIAWSRLAQLSHSLIFHSAEPLESLNAFVQRIAEKLSSHADSWSLDPDPGGWPHLNVSTVDQILKSRHEWPLASKRTISTKKYREWCRDDIEQFVRHVCLGANELGFHIPQVEALLPWKLWKRLVNYLLTHAEWYCTRARTRSALDYNEYIRENCRCGQAISLHEKDLTNA